MFKLSVVLVILYFSAFFMTEVYGQEEKMEGLLDLSLEELMGIEIYSASSKEEALFDAPVSSYSITKEEISKSGVNSIPEALRLAPGVIVREVSNGNYDVRIRGFDNLARFTETQDQIDFYTLVMIDNRPVFNYNQGGTLWESLAVDLVDVERIEIVRGPSAPLFGSNAVSGVINIITRKIDHEDLSIIGNTSVGSYNTILGNLALGKKLNEKFGFILSGNVQQRDRHDNLNYSYFQGEYFEDVTDIQEPSLQGIRPLLASQYPDVERSMEKYGVNLFMDYTPSEDLNFGLDVGLQDARVQKLYMAAGAPLSFSENDSRYINVTGSYKGIEAKYSFMTGFNNLQLGSTDFIFKYDLNIMDLVLYYDWELSDKLILRPTFNYQKAKYNDEDYLENSTLFGVLNGTETVGSYAGGLRLDYNPIESLRLIAAARSDKFNIQDDPYLSYQFAAVYAIKEKKLIRVVHSRSNGGAFIANTLLNAVQEIPFPEPLRPLSLSISILGDKNLDFTVNTMMEVGFRSKIADNLQIDADLFTQKIDNISLPRIAITEFTTVDTPSGPMPVLTKLIRTYENTLITARQNGLTFSLNYVPNNQLQLKPFLTLQRTKTDGIPINKDNSLSDVMSGTHKGTPTLYGGFFINYMLQEKWNLNLSGYYLSEQTLYHEASATAIMDDPEGDIDGKLILNAKVSYMFWDKMKVYINARNLLNDDNREYYATDRISALYSGGLSYNF